ncbi:MAG: ACR3 family arsenite efflux transporter [Planctomycetota bacterium]|nr:ACR3 family arsenite efflux transporter [Planctomycetota bacterium]
MGIFERYLSLWVGLAILAGVGLGNGAPGFFELISKWEFAGVNLVIALFIWLMIYPMMLKVELKSLRNVGQKPKGLILTLVINWLIKPFTMAALGVLFFKYIYQGMISEAEAGQYLAGLILLGVAPCTAMVFVWSHLTDGDANYTLVQVSLNDLILVFAFAPIAGFLLGVTGLEVPWDTLVASCVIFVVIPLLAGLVTQHWVVKNRGELAVEKLSKRLKPSAIMGLLLTVTLLFGFQAETILLQPDRVFLIAAPLLIQSYGIFAIAFGLAKLLKLPFNVAAPAAMIGTSNFFELAVAVAISLFGLNSGAALATVVGVLIEVPVMLSLVTFANRTKHCFPSPTAPA